MLTDKNLFETILLNLGFILAWDAVVFVVCKTLDKSHFNYNKYMYKIKYWEENGNYYRKRLNIKNWKDKLPQYISKKGFSKKNLGSLSLKYIDQFILETCRAEWAHKNCMWIAFVLLFINNFFAGITFFFLVLLINLPYVFIQRYNRIRLIKVKDKILNKSKMDLRSINNDMISIKNLEIADS